eukprot:tig00020828_g14362.t1
MRGPHFLSESRAPYTDDLPEQENVSPAVITRLARELRELATTPPEGIRVIINEEKITDVVADIEGPVGTPYEGGVFRMRLALGQDFPQAPPRGYFITKIFHPNVANNGEICVNVLKKDWKSDMGLQHVLLVIRCLLIVPFPESALNEEAGKLFMEDYEEYCQRARMFTGIYAKAEKKAEASSSKEGVETKAGEAQAKEPNGSESPAAALKKAPSAAKPEEQKKAAIDRKRSIKRL